MNKTELFIKLNNYENDSLMFDDTYLAASTYGLFLGLEFQKDVNDIFSVGDIITINKADKTINPWADGTASIIGITVSSIYPAPGSLVFTDRPLQLPISFTSNENGVIYEGTSISSDWSKVDLSDDVTFPITFNIADVREINNRNGAYSKTVRIPGTKDNNKVFKYIFDIQGIDNYDTRIKVKCNIVVDTIPVLEGYIQLNSIIATDNRYWIYDCTIFGENSNFSKEIDQNARLEDLDFTDLDHTFDINSVTQSWIENWNYGYYYPLIDFNGGQKPRDRYVINEQDGFYIENFRGSIYAKQYWDRIFDKYGYTYQSEFLNSDAFSNLIIPPTKKFLENDPNWRFFSTFRAGLTQSASYTTPYGYQYTPFTSPTDPAITSVFTISIIPPNVTAAMQNTLQLNEVIPPNGDPGGNFFQIPLGNFYYKNVYENTYDKPQKVVLNLDFDFGVEFFNGNALTEYNLLGTRLIFYCDIYKNNTIISRKSLFNYGGSSNAVNANPTQAGSDALVNAFWDNLYGAPEVWNLDVFRRHQIQVVADTAGGLVIGPNDEIRFKLGAIAIRRIVVNNSGFILQQHWLNTRFSFDYYSTTNGQDGTYLFNEIYPELIDNQPVTGLELVPKNIKQIDYINSIVNMFNLYLYQDKNNPKNIFIEPRDRFYETSKFLDWSNKLDISKDITQTPIVEKYKRVTMKYKEDKDFYNASYKSFTNEIYGQFEYFTGDEISNAEKKIDLIFSPTPLNMWSLNDSVYDNSFIYSRIFDPKQPITTETFLKVESNIRILYRKTIPITSSQLAVWNGQTQYLFNTYPYAGHLDDPQDAGLDLSFDEPKILFYENNFLYTDNNLYNEYYAQFFEEIYGPNSKLITAYVYLNSQDILDFDYRKLIYLNNISSGSPGYFRVNKIEWDPFNKQSYKVELIKVLNNFKSKYSKRISLGDVGVVLPGTGNGLVTNGGNTSNGNNNVISGLNNNSQGKNNLITGGGNTAVCDNNIVSGLDNSVSGRNNSIIGGRLSSLYSSDSSIIGGASNSITAYRSVIIGGYNNEVNLYSSNSLILSGYSNKIGATSSTQSSLILNSFLLGGCNNTIYAGTTLSNTDNVFIIGGVNNTIASGVTNSFILGGENFTATQSNTIYLQGNVLINGAPSGGSTPIPTGEVAYGNGTGITSVSSFKVTSGRSLLVSNNSLTDASSTTGLAFGTDGSTLDGSNNMILSSKTSCVDGGYNSIITSAGSCVIIGTGTKYSNIIGSGTSCVSGYNNTIIGSRNSCSGYVSGYSNTIMSSGGSVVDGYYNSIISASTTGIGNAPTYNSFIIGGKKHNMSANDGVITNSSIIAGCCHYLQGTSDGTSIISGYKNNIINSNNSVILGGNNLTLSSEDNTVLVPSLIVNDNISFTNVSGTATITAGVSITVNNTSVTAGSKILITGNGNSTFYVTNIVAATSFDINAGILGTYTIYWLIIN